MQELYRDEDTVAYRLQCTDNNHEHVLDVEIDSEDNRAVLVSFQECLCSKTRNLLWRITTALRVLFGCDICLREVIIDRNEVDKLIKALDETNR